MYQVGELVVYRGEGVCRVEAVGLLNIPGVQKDRLYYTLAPLYFGGKIYCQRRFKNVRKGRRNFVILWRGKWDNKIKRFLAEKESLIEVFHMWLGEMSQVMCDPQNFQKIEKICVLGLTFGCLKS